MPLSFPLRATSLAPQAYPLMAPDGTAAAPSYSFASETNTGFYRVSNTKVRLQLGGANGSYFEFSNIGGISETYQAEASPRWAISRDGLSNGASGISFSVGIAPDLFIGRDAANTLVQRNGINAQTFRIYNTFTDAANYERLALKTVIGASVEIAAESAGTGSANLDLLLTPKGTGLVRTGTVANGAVATVLGALGPAGANVAVQEWLSIKNAAGTVRYIPMF